MNDRGKSGVSRDIGHILDGWEFDPEHVTARIVKGDDGREKIQLRLDLGLLQMELDGRPDGLRPEGCESWLEYYRQQQRDHAGGTPDPAPFQLDDQACERLLREGIQYYHRYLSFWHLQRYELCARDTSRNLKLFQFVRQHARSERDIRRFDQWRPYVTMMHARSVATPLVELGQYQAAIQSIEAGIRGIRQFLEDYNQQDRSNHCPELVQLERWRQEVASRVARKSHPKLTDPVERLRLQLNEAISSENFEEAARLRDEISRLSGLSGPIRPEEKL